jgi:hypothetical protein
MSNKRFGWHSGKVHCKELKIGDVDLLATEVRGTDLAFTGSLYGSGSTAVGQNIVLTTAGTGGTWASALYAKISQGTTKNVAGYLCAAEFEISLAACTGGPAQFSVLTLNSADNNSTATIRSFIWMREYGSLANNAFVRFGLGSEFTVATTDKTTLLSTAADLGVSHTLRILVGETPYWILLNATGP